MNIFHLHKDAEVCARYHCDKHVVKMILETGQMLSTAYQRHCGEHLRLYKPAYAKHPMTIWVGDSLGNYLWSLDLLGHLLNQYRHRYNNKIHSTGRILNNLLKLMTMSKINLNTNHFSYRHYVCLMNTSVIIILKHIVIIISVRKNDSQSIR